MKRIDLIRRDNLYVAIDIAGTAAKLAEMAGVSSAYLSQIKTQAPESKTGKPKGMGDEVARKIEAALGKPEGWMDVGRGYKDEATQLLKNHNEIEIPQYNGVGGSMGTGLLLRDQPGEIHGWRVTPDWITKNVKNHTGATNLRIVTGFGDSMRPLFNPGDPLLVDAGIKSVDFDSIYFFRIGDEGFIKRLQRVPKQGLIAISENPSYRDWTITPDMDVEIFGRVIKVWCGSEF